MQYYTHNNFKMHIFDTYFVHFSAYLVNFLGLQVICPIYYERIKIKCVVCD